jgi:hypothetical protein
MKAGPPFEQALTPPSIDSQSFTGSLGAMAGVRPLIDFHRPPPRLLLSLSLICDRTKRQRKMGIFAHAKLGIFINLQWIRR